MSKIFEYLPDLKIVREKPRMEKPEHPKPRTLSYQNAVYEWQCAMIKYENHLATLTTYPASGFSKEHEGMDLVLGKDFYIADTILQTKANGIGFDEIKATPYAVPLEAEVEKQGKGWNYMHEFNQRLYSDLMAKFDAELKSYVLKGLNSLGFTFQDDTEFIEFIKQRVTIASHEDNPHHKEIFLDRTETDSGTFLGSYNDNMNISFNDNKVIATIGK